MDEGTLLPNLCPIQQPRPRHRPIAVIQITEHSGPWHRPREAAVVSIAPIVHEHEELIATQALNTVHAFNVSPTRTAIGTGMSKAPTKRAAMLRRRDVFVRIARLTTNTQVQNKPSEVTTRGPKRSVRVAASGMTSRTLIT